MSVFFILTITIFRELIYLHRPRKGTYQVYRFLLLMSNRNSSYDNILFQVVIKVRSKNKKCLNSNLFLNKWI